MFFLRSDFPEPVGHKSAPILLFSVHELPPLLMLLPEKQLHLFLDTLSSIVRGRYLPGHILYRFVLVASRQWLSDVLLLILIPDCESAFACYLLLLFLLLYHISENFLPSLSGFRGAFHFTATLSFFPVHWRVSRAEGKRGGVWVSRTLGGWSIGVRLRRQCGRCCVPGWMWRRRRWIVRRGVRASGMCGRRCVCLWRWRVSIDS